MKYLLIALFLAATLAHAQSQKARESTDSPLARAQVEYADRLKAATEAVVQVRARIADERAPLLKEQRDLETQLLTLQGERLALETGATQAAETKKTLAREYESFRTNIAYLLTLAKDTLVTLEQSVAPGEPTTVRDSVSQLRSRLNQAAPTDGKRATTALEVILARLKEANTLRTIRGAALVDGSTEIQDGTFLILGPETLFVRADGKAAGTVRLREGTPLPVVYPLANWQASEATAVAERGTGTVALDSSGGKALRLQQTKGTLAQHIHQGGVVAYAIIAVGVVALLLALVKLRDVRRLSVDEPGKVDGILQQVAEGNVEQAEALSKSLKPTTRELFAQGFARIHSSRQVLDDQLESFITKQRLDAEKRLPLLAVIATAAPLMGLLGTVMGMVKTFALITVFGTGNAAKLSSGISEVLVTTELGLAVAIPSLIAHGVLSHRVQKKIAYLERYAFEMALARDSAREKAGAVLTDE